MKVSKTHITLLNISVEVEGPIWENIGCNMVWCEIGFTVIYSPSVSSKLFKLQNSRYYIMYRRYKILRSVTNKNNKCWSRYAYCALCCMWHDWRNFLLEQAGLVRTLARMGRICQNVCGGDQTFCRTGWDCSSFLLEQFKISHTFCWIEWD